ncbi:MAG: hypothetical protein HYV14_05085 [Elusimicrobia bacterium]|nr:hypothetical protein [Elusimicrobiota bacterium]
MTTSLPVATTSLTNAGTVVSTFLSAAGMSRQRSEDACPLTQSRSVPVDPTVTPDPGINAELMSRLITRTLASKKPGAIGPSLAKIFGLNDGTGELPFKQVSETHPEGKHYFTVRNQEGTNDIIIAFKLIDNTYGEYYLTDKTGVLRAAAIFENDDYHLITNEQAAEKYKAELKLFAKLAKDLPPAGTAVAGNS